MAQQQEGHAAHTLEGPGATPEATVLVPNPCFYYNLNLLLKGLRASSAAAPGRGNPVPPSGAAAERPAPALLRCWRAALQEGGLNYNKSKGGAQALWLQE